MTASGKKWSLSPRAVSQCFQYLWLFCTKTKMFKVVHLSFLQCIFLGSTIYKFKYDLNTTQRLLQQITNDNFVEDYTYDFDGDFLYKTSHLGRIEEIASQKETEIHSYRPQIWPSREENSPRRILLPAQVGSFKVYSFKLTDRVNNMNSM